MSLPRISAISFLNTAPLMWDFDRTELGRKYDISYTIPALCAESLRAGTADIGLIPAVTYLSIPDLAIVPGIAIASLDRVWSIALVTRKPLEDVKTIGADISSRTSVVLCDLLMRRHFPAHRDGSRARLFTRHAPDVDSMLAKFDAGLLIGDSALRLDTSDCHVYDLAHEWRTMTGKPFCFAFWAVRKNVARSEMIEHFTRSRDQGLQPQNLETLAREWAPKVGISEDDVRRYLTENIHYDLDEPVLDGLKSFLSMASDEGLLPRAPELEFVKQAASNKRQATN